jgi:cell division septation protein DedD
VSRQYFIGSVLFFGIVFSLMSCVSSEETGAGNRAKSPVQVFGSIDTTHNVGSQNLKQDSMVNSKKSSINFSENSSRVAPKFKSKQDTVRASVIKKMKSSTHLHLMIERPEHPMYTVQIGAFTQASNALRTQKKAKGRFTHQPVFNKYVKSAKLYRVSVGRYEDRKNAFALSDTLKEQYSKEYNHCWINFIL